jgi:SAM-dependent methyltransferase
MTTTPDWRWACPACRGVLVADGPDALVCPTCGSRHERIDGIWRFLTGDAVARYERFLAEYEMIRRAEGRGSTDPAYYRNLPVVADDDPLRDQWRMRATSWRHARRLVLEGRTTPARVLDLGAGLGWLSHQIARAGHHPVAVDLSVDDLDGLGAARHLDPVWPRVQAEFDHLPLADGEADVVIFNASLHYSVDYAVTLGEALRVLRPDGALVLMDSPIYRDAEAGRSMVLERQVDFERRFGTRSNSVPSIGFLSVAMLDELADQLGVTWQRVTPWYGWRWALRPWRARLRRQRERSRFEVVVGRRRPG